MPLEKLSTGIDLYYESQGRGEAIVFIPGTGFSGNVWMETQIEPLSRSLHVIVHDPRGCGRSTLTKVSAPLIRWPMTSPHCWNIWTCARRISSAIPWAAASVFRLR